MKNKTFIIIFVALLGGILLGNMVIAPFLFTVLIPTTGRVSTIEVTWLDGTEVTQIDWGTVDNNTETALPQLINITNIRDKEVTLSLSATNQVNITALSLSWNATSPLPAGSSTIVQLNQTLTASEETWSYDVKIDATG